MSRASSAPGADLASPTRPTTTRRLRDSSWRRSVTRSPPAVPHASAPEDPADAKVTIAGKYCESTDILISDIEMPALNTGDVIAIPAAGAYCLAMASNYNGMPRPEVVMVRDGEARVMRRRETLDDLLAAEVF